MSCGINRDSANRYINISGADDITQSDYAPLDSAYTLNSLSLIRPRTEQNPQSIMLSDKSEQLMENNIDNILSSLGINTSAPLYQNNKSNQSIQNGQTQTSVEQFSNRSTCNTLSTFLIILVIILLLFVVYWIFTKDKKKID